MPHYRLAAIQAQMVDVASMQLTKTALDCILYQLRWELEDAVAMIQALKRTHFYKSMTAHGKHRVWQDVYHAEWMGVQV
ncbi:MAG TPA: type II toxin-antitoxin system MqsR family toxin [Pseudomonadota bacterium]|nr:type II toxin-antitoxin system MqsR family toxin [Pseudomonadota bacterium]